MKERGDELDCNNRWRNLPEMLLLGRRLNLNFVVSDFRFCKKIQKKRSIIYYVQYVQCLD
jgi:hypothetical protein